VWLSIGNTGSQGTAVVAQVLPRIIDVAQDVILTALAQELFRFVSSQTKSSLVPVQDSPVPIHEVHTIDNVVQQLSIKAGTSWHRRIMQFIGHDKNTPNCIYYPML
jgi:hypothetical protein